MVEERGISKFEFDAYDVLAYLVPGATMLFGVYVHARLFDVAGLLEPLAKAVPYWNSQTTAWFQSAVCISIFLFSAYLVGHIVASFSAAIMDKLLMERIYGYPYERLFNKELGPSKYERNKRYQYKCILTLFLFGVVYFSVRGRFDGLLIGALGAAGFLIATKLLLTSLLQRDMRSSFALRAAHDWRRKLGEHLWDYGIGLLCKPMARFLFDSVGYFLLSLFRMCKPFYPAFQALFVTEFKRTFGVSAKEVGTDAFWLTYSHVIQRDPTSARVTERWLHLYGFSRNLGTCFLFLLIYGAIMRSVGKGGTYYVAWSLTTGLAAMTLILRFYYIYYNYFSKYIFRAFVAMQKSPGTP